MQSLERKAYVNEKQARFLSAKQKRKTFQAGRGAGKSDVLLKKQYLKYNALPRAKNFVAGRTFNQVHNITFAAANQVWGDLGLQEYDPKTGYGHYVRFQRPPAHWLKAYQAPTRYEHTYSFINGYTIELLSMDRPDLARGGNYDCGDADESALLKRDIFFKVLRPMIRANRYRYKHYLHWSLCDYTSAPWLPWGMWVYETEELMKQEPDKYLFVEATAVDNIEVLGQEYIDNLRAEMSPLEFDVEVMNKRLTKLPNGFYPAFKSEHHLVAETYGYEFNDEARLWLTDNSFINPKAPLETSWDFNAKFTSLIVCQEARDEFRCLDALYVKDAEHESLVVALTKKFCEEYANHGCKEVFIYGDRNGNNKTAGDNRTFYEKIMETLRANGWECTLMVEGLDPDHKLKHFLINDMLSETNARLPKIRMHQDKCKFLAISMDNAPILPDWRKDKTSEAQLIDQARATHLSDCFDNIVYRKYARLFGVQQQLTGLVYTI